MTVGKFPGKKIDCCHPLSLSFHLFSRSLCQSVFFSPFKLPAGWLARYSLYNISLWVIKGRKTESSLSLYFSPLDVNFNTWSQDTEPHKIYFIIYNNLIMYHHQQKQSNDPDHRPKSKSGPVQTSPTDVPSLNNVVRKISGLIDNSLLPNFEKLPPAFEDSDRDLSEGKLVGCLMLA